MKLRSNVTGAVAEFISIESSDDEYELNIISADGVECSIAYRSLAKLAAEWEDYEALELKHYRLKKDLPTFNEGDEFEIDPQDGCLYLVRNIEYENHWKRPVMAYHRTTLEKFPNILADWFEPVKRDSEKTRSTEKPLIKDEKVRKAVRAWAEANGVREAEFEYVESVGSKISHGAFSAKIVFYEDLGLANRKRYTIDELCGDWEDDYEVIGNIHENPELLKEADEP